jgi:hypothetical protein
LELQFEEAPNITADPGLSLQYDQAMSNFDRDIPLLLWPFYAIWRLLTFVLEVVGRLLCALIGLALIAAGSAITITVLAAPVGIPIAAIGFLLLVRAIF